MFVCLKLGEDSKQHPRILTTEFDTHLHTKLKQNSTKMTERGTSTST